MISISTISGPNDTEYLYYLGVHDDPRFQKVRTVSRAALVAGSITKDDEKAALTADLEQMYANYVATQE